MGNFVLFDDSDLICTRETVKNFKKKFFHVEDSFYKILNFLHIGKNLADFGEGSS